MRDPFMRMLEDLVGLGDGLHCFSCKPRFWQCGCGKWQINLDYENQVSVFIYGVWDTKMAAVEAMVDIIVEQGIPTGTATRH